MGGLTYRVLRGSEALGVAQGLTELRGQVGPQKKAPHGRGGEGEGGAGIIMS